MKKGYNPFKMWGSYVGATALAIFGRFSTNKFTCINQPQGVPSGTLCGIDASPIVGIWEVLSGGLKTAADNVPYWAIGLSLSVIGLGFVLGWGVHSLVRKIRKK